MQGPPVRFIGDPGPFPVARISSARGAVSGIMGARALSLVENWDDFLTDPVRFATTGGLTWHGGMIAGALAIYLYLRAKRAPVGVVFDGLGVGAMLGYGIARIGCFLAGDGDYGIPTRLPWGATYSRGLVKPAEALEGFFTRHPEARQSWDYDELRAIPSGVDDLGHSYSRFDELTTLHPTSIYELILAVPGFALLWRLSKRGWSPGALFIAYLIVSSLLRFGIEFLKLNPPIALGLTQAQWISLALLLLSGIGLYAETWYGA